MNQDKTFLGTEPIGKLLRQLAIPTVIAQLVNMLYNIVDRIYIGHIPGDGDLALTGCCGAGICCWPSAPARTPSATPPAICRSTLWAPCSCS